MGQGDSRSPRPLLEDPLLENNRHKPQRRRTSGGVGAFGWCMVFVNLCWGALMVGMYAKLTQKKHTHNVDAAIIWILNQLGEGDMLDEHPPSDPWWETRPLGALDLTTSHGNTQIFQLQLLVATKLWRAFHYKVTPRSGLAAEHKATMHLASKTQKKAMKFFTFLGVRQPLVI